MMVHVDESFSFHTSRNSYVNFDLISFPGLTLPSETNDIPENLKKIIRVKASRPLVINQLQQRFFNRISINRIPSKSQLKLDQLSHPLTSAK